MVKMTVPGPFTMSQQAQNDYYKDPAEMALDYAAAVNEEIKDLFAAGADIVQIDEPYMQARPEKAREFGLAAVKRALEGVTGTTALHICFGYAAIIHVRPEGYSFLPELGDTALMQISIETAQSKLDTSVLATLPGKTIILGVIDLNDMTVETAETVAERIRRALPYVPADQDHRRARLRDEVPAARRRLRQDEGDGGRGGDRARRGRGEGGVGLQPRLAPDPNQAIRPITTCKMRKLCKRRPERGRPRPGRRGVQGRRRSEPVSSELRSDEPTNLRPTPNPPQTEWHRPIRRQFRSL